MYHLTSRPLLAQIIRSVQEIRQSFSYKQNICSLQKLVLPLSAILSSHLRQDAPRIWLLCYDVGPLHHYDGQYTMRVNVCRLCLQSWIFSGSVAVLIEFRIVFLLYVDVPLYICMTKEWTWDCFHFCTLTRHVLRGTLLLTVQINFGNVPLRVLRLEQLKSKVEAIECSTFVETGLDSRGIHNCKLSVFESDLLYQINSCVLYCVCKCCTCWNY